MRLIFDFLYNDAYTTGLKVKKLSKKISNTYESLNLNDLHDVIVYLIENNTGSDEVIYNIQQFIEKQPVEHHEFLKQLFTKSYKSGATASSINKAFGFEFIQQFKVQLAASYDAFADKVTGSFFLTQKLDGHRTIAIVENGKLSFKTRKGNLITGLLEIEKELLEMTRNIGLDNVVFDGEILIDNADDEPENAFNNTSKIIRKNGNKENLNFHIFDMLSLNSFKQGASILEYKDRREKLGNILTDSYKHLKLVETLYHGDDRNKIAELMVVAKAKGWEGLMFNVAEGINSIYYTKRHKGLLKVKEFFSADLYVEGLLEGSGDNVGKLGSVVLRLDADNTVSCGSGFTPEQRVYYWENPEEILNKIVEVNYFEKTTNQKGGTSLRFPTFVTVRSDKTIDDVNIE